MAEKVATRLHTEREELASNQEELSATLAHWAMSEPQLVDPIRCMGTCVENCTTALSTLVREGGGEGGEGGWRGRVGGKGEMEGGEEGGGGREPQLVDPIRCMGTCVENCTTALSTLVREEGGGEGKGNCCVCCKFTFSVRMRIMPSL